MQENPSTSTDKVTSEKLYAQGVKETDLRAKGITTNNKW